MFSTSITADAGHLKFISIQKKLTWKSQHEGVNRLPFALEISYARQAYNIAEYIA